MRNPQVHDYLTRNDGLATRLRKARGDMPAKDLAAAAGWLPSKVSKIEAGKQLPSADDLGKWAQHTGVDNALLGQWQAMLVEAQTFRNDFEIRMRDGQKAVQREYNELIAATTTFRFFEMTYVPRFLQIPEYTKVVLTEQHKLHGGIEDVDAAVDERQESVGYLYDSRRSFDFIVDEAVLRRRRVQPDVMRQQLDRLQSAIGLRNVRIGIIPLDEQIDIFPQNSFELYGDVGYVETFYGDDPKLLIDVVSKYNRVMDLLWESAVEGDKARRLILDAQAHLPR
jgi:transcriptional regulator with XRE-family HTH domain